MAALPRRHRRFPLPCLMLVATRQGCSQPLARVVEQALEGGVNLVQLREKHTPAGELLTVARELRAVTAGRALLVINDRVDVALLSGADGVHLGEAGLPVTAVRKLLPPSMLVGRSIHSVHAARQAEGDGADYLLAGTLFPTATHPQGEAQGTGLLAELVSRVTLPVLGIGGVHPGNSGECWQAGAHGLAAQSALLRADDPAAVARALLAGYREPDA